MRCPPRELIVTAVSLTFAALPFGTLMNALVMPVSIRSVVGLVTPPMEIVLGPAATGSAQPFVPALCRSSCP